MTVKEFLDQLKLAKNKDAKLVFRIGEKSFDVSLMTEAVVNESDIHFPSLGEVANAVAIKLKETN